MHVNTEDRLGETRAKLTYAAAQADLRGLLAVASARSSSPLAHRSDGVFMKQCHGSSDDSKMLLQRPKKQNPQLKRLQNSTFFFFFFSVCYQNLDLDFFFYCRQSGVRRATCKSLCNKQ